MKDAGFFVAAPPETKVISRYHLDVDRGHE